MNPQKETEKAVKRAEKAKRAKATYAQRMEARTLRLARREKWEDFWYGIGTEWRYQLAVRQLCRAVYRSIREDYMQQVFFNARNDFDLLPEWTVHLYGPCDEDGMPDSNTFGLSYFPTGFYGRDRITAGRAMGRIKNFGKLKTTETSNALLADIAKVFNQKHGKTFKVSYEEGTFVHISLEGPHPVAKI